MKEKKYKHMTLESRIDIQECMCKGMSFKDIGKRISKDQTKISKEVKKHLVVYSNGFTKVDECYPKLLKAHLYATGVRSRAIAAVDTADRNMLQKSTE